MNTLKEQGEQEEQGDKEYKELQTVQEKEDPLEEEHLDGQEKAEAAAVVRVGRAAAVLQGEHPVQLEDTDIKEALLKAVFPCPFYSILVIGRRYRPKTEP